MSDGMNKVMLLGNLGADAELKYMPSGEAVCDVRMATTSSWFDKEAGARQERTEWHRISIFGKRGEGLAKYLKKGDRIMVEGELRTKKYEKEGVTHYTTSVIARAVFFAGSAKGVVKGDKAKAVASDESDIPFGGEGEDIPFDVPEAAAAPKGGTAKPKNGKNANP